MSTRIVTASVEAKDIRIGESMIIDGYRETVSQVVTEFGNTLIAFVARPWTNYLANELDEVTYLR